MDCLTYAIRCYDKWWPVTVPWMNFVIVLNLRDARKQAVRLLSFDVIESKRIALFATGFSAILGFPIALLSEVGHAQHVFIYWLMAMAVHFSVLKIKHPEFGNKLILFWSYKSNSLVWSYIAGVGIIVLEIAVALAGS